MPNLEDVLAQAPTVRWLIGKVGLLTGDTFTMIYNGGFVLNVGCSDQYIPAVGDIVHVLAWEPNGMLAVCSNNTPLTPPTPTVPVGTPITVSANAYGTYNLATLTWTASTLVQSPTQVACWFYTPSDFASLASSTLAKFEIEVTRTSGGPPEFVTHTNTAGSGALGLPGQKYAKVNPPAAVATFIPLPLEWGQQLIAGTIKGIGIGGGLYSGAYSNATGRARLTPL